MFTTDRHNITAHGPGPALLLVWVPVLVPQVAADEGRGHAEVEGEEEREDGHHRVQLQHHAALVLAEARLLDAARLLVDGLLLVVKTDHRHPVGHVPLLVGGAEGLVILGQIPLKRNIMRCLTISHNAISNILILISCLQSYMPYSCRKSASA